MMALLKNNFFHLILCFILIVSMVAIAELKQEREIIFPEIAALAIGAWAAPKQIWCVNRFTMIVLIIVNSCLGVCISTFLYLPLYFKTIFGLLCAILTLILSRSTFFPAVSACILPIFLNTKGWVYPVSAIVMTIVICSVQWILEKVEKSTINQRKTYSKPKSQELKLWLLRYVFLLIIAVLPLNFGQCFFVAPPLIVSFIEFTQPESTAVNKIKKIFLLMLTAAFGGAISRLILTTVFNIPLTVSAAVVVLLLLSMMYLTKVYFPPAGAIAILPLLIDEKFLIFYPFEVIVGFTILCLMALIVKKIIKKSNPEVIKV